MYERAAIRRIYLKMKRKKKRREKETAESTGLVVTWRSPLISRREINGRKRNGRMQWRLSVSVTRVRDVSELQRRGGGVL